jgi:hypothetical protein
MLCQVCQDTYLAGREKVSSSPAFSLRMSVELKLTLRTRLLGTNWKTMQKVKDVRDRSEMDEVKAKWFPASDPSQDVGWIGRTPSIAVIPGLNQTQVRWPVRNFGSLHSVLNCRLWQPLFRLHDEFRTARRHCSLRVMGTLEGASPAPTRAGDSPLGREKAQGTSLGENKSV